MQTPVTGHEARISVKLCRAPDDAPLGSAAFQKELSEFARALSAQGIDVRSRHFTFDSVSGGGGLAGEFTLIASSILIPVSAVAGAWLQAKCGRRVRVKFGDTEAEATTVEELEKVLRMAEEARRKTVGK